jgi:hypothetical protein
MARTLVLHSTEGSTLAGAVATLRRNRSESNWVFDPETGELVTLTDSERGDRSLRNLPGGVETNNRAGVWQIEIVGHATDIPHMPERWFRRLGAVVSSLCDGKGIPRAFPCRFVAYPESYGLKAAQRLTGAQWLTVEGIVGHQHVPENTHGDPGDISRLIPHIIKETTMPIPSTPTPTWSLLDLDDVNTAVGELFHAYHGIDTYQTDLDSWSKDLAQKLAKGTDPRPTLAFIEWALREPAEAARKAAGR